MKKNIKPIDKSTCWYDEDCTNMMILAARGEYWPRLEKSDHWPILLDLFQEIPVEEKGLSVLDIGCGAGELGRVLKEIVPETSYFGVDLPHIIDRVARVVNPFLHYGYFDIYKSDETTENLIKHSDIVVMNAFIDVLESPLRCLERILRHCSGYVILHRQSFTDSKTFMRKHSSYGTYSYQSVINRPTFQDLLKDLGFEIVKERMVYPERNHCSLLLKKI